MNTNRIVTGILAHVDAGKTTLAEGILYLTGSIRKLGRVDHQDAFLDNFELERSRGITIFSKQAEVMLGDRPVTLMDTPGHVDFSAEMERTLQILDYAILVISGADGVQGHVETLWKLLQRYDIPVFLFINKMDQPGTDRDALMKELCGKFDSRCLDFSGEKDEEFWENLAVCDEAVMEAYLENGVVETKEIIRMISERSVFPCYFGSALKMQGVEELLEGIRTLCRPVVYPDSFGARVFKITRDAQGTRLTHMKITGGSLKVKTLLSNQMTESGIVPKEERTEEYWEEKADQIRIYSGSGFTPATEVSAGMVCAVTGLTKTYAGEGLGAEHAAAMPLLEPVLSYQIVLPPECDVHRTYLQLQQLEEEEPELHIFWDEQLGELYAQLMGEVQIEVLKSIIKDRFQISVEFGEGHIVYKETISNVVEGIGHFEPLRHYAEAHILMEPGEPGSGLQFFTACSEDLLDKNWQRLILTHLEEKKHKGVLVGGEITDIRMTVIAGRAHAKHTEGGDFRQATYRAVRHGLMCAQNVLLEPVYEFRMEVPQESVGRAMADIQGMAGNFTPPEIEQDMAVLCGTAPVATMRGYQTKLVAYTRGRGRLTCSLKGYEPCHNAEEVIYETGYDPDADLANPTGSVFCSHGAGYLVPWDLVRDYAHVDTSSLFGFERRKEDSVVYEERQYKNVRSVTDYNDGVIDEEELEEIFNRTYGSVKRDKKPYQKPRRVEAGNYSRPSSKPAKKLDEYLLVDGYNIIFAWEDLKELAKVNVESARNKLMDILCNYQGYKKMKLILVFDAYKVQGGVGEVIKYHNIHVVYTKEAETADQYIEKTVHEIGRQYNVTVATSDALEQVIILGQGAVRMSAANLRKEISQMEQEIREQFVDQRPHSTKNYLLDQLSEEAVGVLRTIADSSNADKKKQ